MVDTTDLKSVDLYGREGSSPSDPNNSLVFSFVIRYSNYNFKILSDKRACGTLNSVGSCAKRLLDFHILITYK